MLIGRILSLLVAIAYVVVSLLAGAGLETIKIAAFLALPLACIWFSDEMGDYAGVLMQGGPMSRTPGIIVAVAGWLLLFAPVLMTLYGRFATED